MTIMPFSSSSKYSLLTAMMLAVPLLLATVGSSSAVNTYVLTLKVHIRNELNPGKVLYVYCHCTDHDQDPHWVNVGNEYSWTFNKHVFWQTLWQCYLAPDYNNHAYFHVFDVQTPNYDSDIVFAAKEDGVYHRNLDTHEDEFYSHWKRNKKIQ